MGEKINTSFWYVFPRLLSNSSLICNLVILEHGISVTLSRIIHIRIIKKILNTQQDLFDGNSWLPRFLLIQDRKANRARREYIGMKQGWGEFTFGRFGGIILGESHGEFVEPTLPRGPCFAGYSDLPFQEVHRTIGRLHRLRVESKGVVFPPLLALFR